MPDTPVQTKSDLLEVPVTEQIESPGTTNLRTEAYDVDITPAPVSYDEQSSDRQSSDSSSPRSLFLEIMDRGKELGTVLGRCGEKLGSLLDELMLHKIEEAHFRYFKDMADPDTGLTLDRSTDKSLCSVAAVGFSLTAFPIGVERGWVTREEAGCEALKVLRTLWNSPQGEEASGRSGKHGFFYHFLDAKNGTRHGGSEISTIDTALLMAGVLFAESYYDRDSDTEREIRELSRKLYERVDWPKALDENGSQKLSHGWFPESGQIKHFWSGYDEGTIMMLLALGSPTHPLKPEAFDKYFSTARRSEIEGQDHIIFGPLFGHQYGHSFIDFKGINNQTTKSWGFDLFENSRRATLAQNFYAQRNPQGWKGYSALDWGLTACDGPGWESRNIDGKDRQFFSYIARGYPDAPDDGTIAPTAAASSLPFAPDIVLPTLRHWTANRPEILGKHGYYDSFNMTYDSTKPSGWVAPDHLGIDQGAILLAFENYRSSMVWDTMKRSQHLRNGLEKAGFSGGWLEKE